MNRREFLKTTSILGSSSILMPNILFANGNSEIYKNIKFNETLFNEYNAQNIVIFLYGGCSELAGNMSNFEDIKSKSQNKYPDIDITKDSFWSEAGGIAMQKMLDNKNMSIVRTINRQLNNKRSHRLQQMENLRGANSVEKAGFFRDILEILYENGKIDSTTIIPAITLKDSDIYANGNLETNSILNPISISNKLDNPFDFGDSKHLDGISDIFYNLVKDRISKDNSNNYLKKIGSHFFTREKLSGFIDEISAKTLPIEFNDNIISDSLNSTLKLMLNNNDTKLAFINHPLGWDDHSKSINQYKNRHNELIDAIDKSVEVLKEVNNKTINIFVMTEFGRNVNLNNSFGWDHGNQFNLMMFSNNDKLGLGKIIGETDIYTENGNRLYTKPKLNSIEYEPYSIASTIAKLFGIENYEEINGYKSIDELI